MAANNVHIPLVIHENKDSGKGIIMRVESNDSNELYSVLMPILSSPRKRNGCYEVLERNRDVLYARLRSLFGYVDEFERIELARQGKLCTVRVCLDDWQDAPRFEMFGFQWVWRGQKENPVYKHRFVNIDDSHGGFPPQGGSRQNPKLAPLPNTYLEALFIPISTAEKTIQNHPELFNADGCGIIRESQPDADEQTRRERDAQTLIDNIGRHRIEVEKQIQRIKTLPSANAWGRGVK